MKKILTNVFKFSFFLGLGIFLIWWVLHGLSDEDIKQMKQSFAGIHYWLFIPLAVIGFSSHFIRALRWKLLLHPLNYHPSNANTFFAVMVGYLANLAFPRLGEVSKCGILNRYEKIPIDKLIGTILIERVIDVLCLLTVIGVTIFLQLNVLGAFFKANVYLPLVNRLSHFSGVTYLVVLAIGILLIVILRMVLKRYNSSKTGQSVIEKIKGITEGLKSVWHMQNKGLFLLYTIGIWLSYYGMMHLCFYCLAETSVLGILAALACLSFGSIGIIATQGGIGAYQVIIMKTLLLYGIAQPIGFAFGWVGWVAQTLLILVLGGLSLVLLPILNKDIK